MVKKVTSTSTRPLSGRVSIVTVAVFGLGGLVAAATALALYLGLSSAASNTSDLLTERAELMIDTLERRVEGLLKPVMEQSRWIAEMVMIGQLDPDNPEQMDTFMTGALAATPQVAGIALVTPDGISRRWARGNLDIIEEDWSGRSEIVNWLRLGAEQTGGNWLPPFWTPTLNTIVVLHDRPLYVEDRFIGMLGQIVPITDLSRHLATIENSMGITPFILQDRERVLAHPRLMAPGTPDQPIRTDLPKLDAIDDAVLPNIWSKNVSSARFLTGLKRSNASVVRMDNERHVFIHREVHTYGSSAWTIGAHLPAEVFGSTIRRLIGAFAAGLLVMVVAAVGAGYAGHRFSRPIRAIASAAHSVRRGELESVDTLTPGPVRELAEATESFNEMVAGLRESQLIRQTLGRFVPEDVARILLSDGGELTPSEYEATVLFSDMVHFTALTEELGPQGIVDLLNEYFETMVRILESHGGIVTQFQGDAILATFNVPVSDPHHARNALRAAREMQIAVDTQTFAGRVVQQRIGINTGPVVAGAVGSRGRLSYTVHGDAVNLAARLEAMNKSKGTRVLVSGDTASLVDDLPLRPLGESVVRGQTGSVAIYELEVCGDPVQKQRSQ